MKIFEFKCAGIKEWIFAPSLKKAKEFYSNLIDDTLEDFAIKKVPKKEWKNITIINSENENDNINFEEWVKENKSICDMIATTNL